MKYVLGEPFENGKGDQQMVHLKIRFAFSALLTVALFLSICLFTAPTAHAQSTSQSTFSSADDALQALVSAAKAKDSDALARIFGPDYKQLLSGDDVEDANDRDEFAVAVGESAQLQKIGDSRYTVTVGKDNWPTPIPLVENDGKWFFDTKAGLDEVINRRVGENELSAIATCRAYAVAQWEYFTEGDWDHDGLAEYAQNLLSTPGAHDGLYWETSEDEKPSPLGKLIAAAEAKVHGPNASETSAAGKKSPNKETFEADHAPYHGYYFRILTRQGVHAPGGKYSYVINGNMIAGYALVAYPDKWDNSGVMTFIINQQGRVYQKNLGPNTAKLAAALTEYDPDLSWKLVEVQP
ncbi:MAG: DUF2950 domain-containing protein [Terriglobales bacterium]